MNYVSKSNQTSLFLYSNCKSFKTEQGDRDETQEITAFWKRLSESQLETT